MGPRAIRIRTPFKMTRPKPTGAPVVDVVDAVDAVDVVDVVDGVDGVDQDWEPNGVSGRRRRHPCRSQLSCSFHHQAHTRQSTGDQVKKSGGKQRKVNKKLLCCFRCLRFMAGRPSRKKCEE